MTDLGPTVFQANASYGITPRRRIFALVGAGAAAVWFAARFPRPCDWHHVGSELADNSPDHRRPPGYGWSDMPDSDQDHTPTPARDGENIVSDGAGSATCIFASLPLSLRRVSYRWRSIIRAGCRGLAVSISCRPMITGSA